MANRLPITDSGVDMPVSAAFPGWRLVAVMLGLAVLTAGVYYPCVGHAFIGFDDPVYVTENQAVHGGLSLAGVAWAFSTYAAGNWHPLTWLSLMLDYQLWGLRASGFHLTNVLLHGGNVLLLFFVLRCLTGAGWRSALVAALFAIHPLHVESVAWVAERKDVLCAFFGLLAIGAYVRYVRHGSGWAYLTAFLFFVLGLMAKPMLVSLPLLLLCLDYWPLRRLPLPTGRDGWRQVRWVWWQRLWEKAPFAAVAAASCVVTCLAQQAGGAVCSVEQMPLDLRLVTAAQSYVVYLLQTAWPVNLAVYYPYDFNPSGLAISGAVFVLLVCSCVIWQKRERAHYLVTGWLWYLLSLVPVIGLVQVGAQARADRYTYLPLIGVFIMLAWGCGDLAAGGTGDPQACRPRRIRCLAASAVAVVLVLAFLARIQVGYWREGITLFRHAAAVTRNNYLAENSLGVALQEAGRTGEAIGHYVTALEFKPDHVNAYYNLGQALATQGKDVEAADAYAAVLRLNPRDDKACLNLGNLMLAHQAFGEAVSLYRQAIAITPTNVKAQRNLALALERQGQFGAAAAQYLEVLRLQPADTEARIDMAAALVRAGSFAAAAAHYRTLICQVPDSLAAKQQLAWLLATNARATSADKDESVRLAESVCAARHDTDPVALDILAVSYACSGRFAEAIAAAERAAALAQGAHQAELVRRIEERLELYRRGKTFSLNAW